MSLLRQQENESQHMIYLNAAILRKRESKFTVYWSTLQLPCRIEEPQWGSAFGTRNRDLEVVKEKLVSWLWWSAPFRAAFSHPITLPCAADVCSALKSGGLVDAGSEPWSAWVGTRLALAARRFGGENKYTPFLLAESIKCMDAGIIHSLHT